MNFCAKFCACILLLSATESSSLSWYNAHTMKVIVLALGAFILLAIVNSFLGGNPFG